MQLKQLRLPILLLFFGLVVTIIGILFKILHWSFASEILTIGLLTEAFGILGLAYKIILHSKQKK